MTTRTCRNASSRSKLDWVIVRPVILTDGPKTNAYRALVDPRRWTCGFISRADVADFLVKQIDDDAGDDARSRHTIDMHESDFSEATGGPRATRTHLSMLWGIVF